jgi:deoxyadenosine/deoxycytidine kinase
VPVLIAITGPIATGATTLANRLAESMSWEKFFEVDVEQTNPFFALYSAHPHRYAFHNQATFLYKSAELHRRLRAQASQEKIYLQDFCPFEHTGVYAYVQHARGYLSPEEYQLLLGLTALIEPYYVVPNVLVYRPLSRERLLQRVQQRGRRSEQSADIEFLDAIRRRFDAWIETWTRSPVIRADEQIDFLTGAEAVSQLGTALLEQIKIQE